VLLPSDRVLTRLRRVRKNLRQGLSLAWTSSPTSFIRYLALGLVNAAIPPLLVYLGALLVDRIVEGRAQGLTLVDLAPVIVALWAAASGQRLLGAYIGFGRELFVRRVQLEAERRLIAKAASVDLGRFDTTSRGVPAI
jgi:hypothetical protein